MSIDTFAAETGHTLLPIARAAIAEALGVQQEADSSASWLKEPGATFVTLMQKGDLRGCIGTLEARRSLLEDVRGNAKSAAFHDPRFAPLSVNELNSTDIEVSLLSAMQALQFSGEQEALAQLRPGVDGVVFQYGHYRSTFLPQVWEQLPTAVEFIAHLKHKAGLPANFWADEVRLSRYTVSKWKETDFQQDRKRA